nr:PTS sugar transporter subunit IIA [Enterococcus sp. MMGLQ5-2]
MLVEKTQLFHQVFSEAAFLVVDEPTTRDIVIKQLLLLLEQAESKDYLEQMLTQIHTREQLGTVAFSSQIAVPHPVVPQGRFPKIAVAIVPKGVRWDEKFPKIQLIFLLSPSQFDNSYFTIFTKAVVELLDMAEVREKMIHVKSFSEFQDIFMKLI